MKGNPEVLVGRNRHRRCQRQGGPAILDRDREGLGVKRIGGRGRACVDGHVVGTGVGDIELDSRQFVATSHDAARHLYAPIVSAGAVAQRALSATEAIAEGVAREGRDIGGEVDGAAPGDKLARVLHAAVAPLVKTATGVSIGAEGNGIPEGVRTATGHTAVIALRRGNRDRGRGRGVPVGDGFDAHDGTVGEVEGVGGVSTGTARSRVQVAHCVETVIASTPTPVEVELALGVVSVANKSVAAGIVAAFVYHGTTGIQLVPQHRAPLGVCIVLFEFEV